MRKKGMLGCLILVFTFLLCSCSAAANNGSGQMLRSRLQLLEQDTSERDAEAKLEAILAAMEARDSDALSALFSVKALEDTEDFEGNAASLFDFVQGDVTAYEKLSGPTVCESSSDGIHLKEVSSYYSVSTTQDKYYFQLLDYPVDTENPDNVGLYMLLVVKDADSMKIYDGDLKIIYDGSEKLSHAGIYLPLR